MANRSEILCILLLPFQTWCFLLLSKGLSSEWMIKWPHTLGDFCFPFPLTQMDWERELLVMQVSQADMKPEQMFADQAVMHTHHFFFLSVKYICYPETSLCPQMRINTFHLESWAIISFKDAQWVGWVWATLYTSLTLSSLIFYIQENEVKTAFKMEISEFASGFCGRIKWRIK